MKEAITSVFGYLDHVRRLKEACESGRYAIPPIPPGSQKLTGSFEVGQRVKATATATVKVGVTGTVTERWEQNGFCYYRVSGMNVQRQQDLEAA